MILRPLPFLLSEAQALRAEGFQGRGRAIPPDR